MICDDGTIVVTNVEQDNQTLETIIRYSEKGILLHIRLWILMMMELALWIWRVFRDRRDHQFSF